MRFLAIIFIIFLSLPSLAQDTIPYLKNGKYAICNIKGEFLSEPEYDDVLMTRSSYMTARKDHDIFLITEKGDQKLIPNISQLCDEITPLNFMGNEKERFLQLKNSTGRYIYDQQEQTCYGPVSQKKNRLRHYGVSRMMLDQPAPSFYTFDVDQISYLINSKEEPYEFDNKIYEHNYIEGFHLLYSKGQDSQVLSTDFEVRLTAQLKPLRTYSNSAFLVQGRDNCQLLQIRKLWDDEIQDLRPALSLSPAHCGLKSINLDQSYHIKVDSLYLILNPRTNDTLYWGSSFPMIMHQKVVVVDGMHRWVHNANQGTPFTGRLSKIRYNAKRSLYEVTKNDTSYLLRDNGDVVLSGRIITMPSSQYTWVQHMDGSTVVYDSTYQAIAYDVPELDRSTRQGTYTYKQGDRYGLVDLEFNKITPPISTRNDFYLSNSDEWVTIYLDGRHYAYHLKEGHQTSIGCQDLRLNDYKIGGTETSVLQGVDYASDSIFIFSTDDGRLLEADTRKRMRLKTESNSRYKITKHDEETHLVIDRYSQDTLSALKHDWGSLRFNRTGKKIDNWTITTSYQGQKQIQDVYGNRLLPDGLSFGQSVTIIDSTYAVVEKDRIRGLYNLKDKRFEIAPEYKQVYQVGTKYIAAVRETATKYHLSTTLFDWNFNIISEGEYRQLRGYQHFIAAQIPEEGTHDHRIHIDREDPDLDFCEGKVIQRENFSYILLDHDLQRIDNEYYIDVSSDYYGNHCVSQVEGQDTVTYAVDSIGQKKFKLVKGTMIQRHSKDLIQLYGKGGFHIADYDGNLKIDQKFKRFNDVFLREYGSDKETYTTYYGANDGEKSYLFDAQFKKIMELDGFYSFESLGQYIKVREGHDYDAAFRIADRNGDFASGQKLKDKNEYSHGNDLQIFRNISNQKVYFSKKVGLFAN